jgi:hypothetical protein
MRSHAWTFFQQILKSMARYKFMAVRFGKPDNGIEKGYKYPPTERSDFAEIVVLAIGKPIGIYGTSSSVMPQVYYEKRNKEGCRAGLYHVLAFRGWHDSCLLGLSDHFLGRDSWFGLVFLDCVATRRTSVG